MADYTFTAPATKGTPNSSMDKTGVNVGAPPGGDKIVLSGFPVPATLVCIYTPSVGDPFTNTIALTAAMSGSLDLYWSAAGSASVTIRSRTEQDKNFVVTIT